MKKLVLALIAVGMLSGCAMLKGPMEPAGVTDWIELPVGAVVTGVTLPTDETGKKYNIVITKPSAIVSMDCLNRMGK
jgi:hypothetical protein